MAQYINKCLYSVIGFGFAAMLFIGLSLQFTTPLSLSVSGFLYGLYLGYVWFMIKQSPPVIPLNVVDQIVTRYIDDGVIITDKTNRIIYVNEAMLTMSEYTRKEVLGNDPKMFRAKVESNVFYKNMWQALQSEDYFNCTMWDTKKNGVFYLKNLSIYAIRDASKTVEYYVAIYKDVSKEISHGVDFDALMNSEASLLTNPSLLVKLIDYKLQAHTPVHLYFVRILNTLTLRRTTSEHLYKQLINQYSKRLINYFKKDTLIAEYDEETLVVAIKSTEKAEHFFDRLNGLAKNITHKNQTLSLETKIGCSSYPKDGDDGYTLMLNAHLAMESALTKSSALGIVFKDSFNTLRQSEHIIQNALYDAIEYEEFTVVYQVQKDMLTDSIPTIEVLARWHSDVLGPVPPGEFIPIAEKYGYIRKISEIVIKQVLRDLKTIHEINPSTRIALNISAMQFANPLWIETLNTIIQDGGYNASFFEIELTETTLIEDIDATIEAIKLYHDKGFSIVIDDFGKGFSSLNYIKDFHIDKLKIDKSFVDDLETDNTTLVKTIIQLAKDLDIDLVAEGVETKKQLDKLLDFGCHNIQGYYIAKPMTLDHLIDFLKK